MKKIKLNFKLKFPSLKKINLKLRILNAYVVSSISVIFVLILTGIIFLLYFNGRKMIRHAKESIQLIILIRPNVSEPDILVFQKELERKPFVKSTDYISKQQGLEEMKAYLGSDIVDILDYNPLPAIIKINVTSKYSGYDKLQKVIQWLMTRPQVDDVFFNKSLIYRLNQNIRLISAVLFVITFLLVLIALTLINNTIRLVVYSKRQEIKTMQLVGASNWFIMRPFLLNSALQGFLSALVADAIIVLSLLYVKLRSNMQFEVYGLNWTLVWVAIVGILITTGATYFAVKYFLWAKNDEIFG